MNQNSNADNNNDSDKTIESEFSIQDDSDPDFTVSLIEKDIHDFFQNTIQNNDPSNIIVTETKGWNLFQPHLKKAVGFHSLTRIKEFNYSKERRLGIYSSINEKKETLLLTDAVKSGDEVNRILNFKMLKIIYQQQISKVCCYVALRQGLDNIKNQHPKIHLNFTKPVDSLSEYEKEQKKLRLVYQNRMEPIDGEHPFVILRTENKNLETDTIKDIIISSIPHFYNGKYHFNEDHLKIKNKKSFTIHFCNPESFRINLRQLSKGNFKFEKLALRFKFSQTESLLRIMGLAMTDYNQEIKSVFYRLMFGKCKQNFPYKACQKYYPLRRFNVIRSGFCPMCVDNNISRFLISDFIDAAQKNSKYNELNWQTIETNKGV